MALKEMLLSALARASDADFAVLWSLRSGDTGM